MTYSVEWPSYQRCSLPGLLFQVRQCLRNSFSGEFLLKWCHYCCLVCTFKAVQNEGVLVWKYSFHSIDSWISYTRTDGSETAPRVSSCASEVLCGRFVYSKCTQAAGRDLTQYCDRFVHFKILLQPLLGFILSLPQRGKIKKPWREIQKTRCLNPW